MPPKPLLKRKRSSADSSLSQEAKRILRPRAAPQTFTPIQTAPVVKARVKRTIANRSAPLVKSKAYSPGSNLLLQKDKIIEQLRLDLADAKSKLSKTQKRLVEAEKKISMGKMNTVSAVFERYDGDMIARRTANPWEATLQNSALTALRYPRGNDEHCKIWLVDSGWLAVGTVSATPIRGTSRREEALAMLEE
ncbi:hypothetical protein D6C89_06514 [Aureobasidium pullulans]|nr:hypothetical protein D6C89_06514 [Aureobasidium pullulans]